MMFDRSVLIRRALIAVAAVVPIGAAVATSMPKDAVAGCQITVSVRNTGSQAFTVNWDESKVKVSGGTWDRLARNSSERVDAGETRSIVYGALWGCGANRRYQIHTSQDGDDETTYFPSSSDWTTDTTPRVDVSM
ncbi:uncharacterized protein SOCE26_063390 [Sorangium cellulosum]|uniref:Secreted protein n=1 Tax=Sorangium cellulosum TaxID=56 RepID=A0A2L0F065_SORCE|nr:hypothetical protein [Sorangium cellulosum]AUX44869.1 uncharacterized protein SOCE26_063390 [Sorangium cellulosum]